MNIYQKKIKHNNTLLIENNLNNSKKYKKSSSFFYNFLTCFCIFFSFIFILDFCNLSITNYMMNSIYSAVEFIFPDYDGFNNENNLGIVAKIFNNDFRYIAENRGVYHIVSYSEIEENNGVLKYIAAQSGIIIAPANSIVESIDYQDQKTILYLILDNNLSIKIEYEGVFAVEKDAYLYEKSIIGLISADKNISITFYCNSVIIENPLSSELITWKK